MRKLVVLFLMIISTVTVSAQVFGGNPASQKWKQIDTDTARIIFPAGLDSQGQRVAAIVHRMAAAQPVALGDKLKKIDIVLQHQTTISNGYVQLGPYRSEFFLTPDINNFTQGSIAWADQLALHEYRHVQQFNNFNNGLSKAMRVLFGQEGYSLAINASIPDWFYEGDAVYNETLLTGQGRGRLSLFLNAYPSLWQAGKKYSWMKLRNGSLKDYVPSHYHLGYLLVNYGYEKYGTDFWAKVTRDASAYKGLFYPFQAAIKKHSGKEYETFLNEAFDYYKKLTPSLQLLEALQVTKEKMEQVTNRKIRIAAVPEHKNLFEVNKNYVTNYLFPYAVDTGSILYLKTTYRHRPAFFIKDAAGERKLRVKDISGDHQFSYRNGKIVYAAYETDPRWGWRDYSVIRVLDIQTRQQRKLTHKTKYFTPDISADGSKVAAVQVAENGRSELHVLDAQSGQLIKAIHSSDILLFTDPKFIDEKNLVTAVRLRDGKMALALAEIETGNTMRLTPLSFNVVGFPNVHDSKVYFTAGYQGNDDVFALRLDDRKIYRLSNGPLGNYYVNAAGGKITWSAFTAEGYQLQEVNEKDIIWTEVAAAETEPLNNIFPVSNGTTHQDFLWRNDLPGNYATKKYRKGTRLLNFHSWRPYYEDPLFTFSLYGENVLNTLQTELYYLYNENDKTSAVGFTTTFGGWFPWISAGTEYTFNRKVPAGNRIYQWDQLDSRIGLSIPLNFTSGRSFKQLNAGTNFVYRRNINKGFLKDSIGGDTDFSYLHHYVSWAQQVPVAIQHIFPKWGTAFATAYRYAITDFSSWQFTGSGSLYLPGLAANHSIVATGAFQEVDTAVTAFANRFSYSRGYTGRYFSRMWRLSANYHFPLWHTDWGFANIVYLQRLRGNIFYDFTKVYSKDKSQTRNQRTVGFELYADTKWWNQHPLTFGFRISRLLDIDQFDGFRGTIYEFILPVSIIPR